MRRIRAISLHQPWATWIAEGLKTIETRTWETGCRGDVLICSTKKASRNIPAGPRFPKGKALAIVELYGCRRMLKRDVPAALCPYEGGRWSWLLRNIRKIEPPFEVRGRQGFYTVEMPEGKRPLHLVRGHIRRYVKKGLLGKYFGNFYIPSHTRGEIE